LSNPWAFETMVNLADIYWDVITKPMTDDETKARFMYMYMTMKLAVEAAVEDLSLLPRHLLPDTIREVNDAYHVALVIASGIHHGRRISKAEINWLCRADQGIYTQQNLVRYIAPSTDVNINVDMTDMDDTITSLERHLRENMPDELRANPEAIALADAFRIQMLKKADDDSNGRAPLIGQFVLTRTGLDIVDALGVDHLRIITNPSGIWISLIFGNHYSLGWWSPSYDNLNLQFGQRYAWIFRTMLACLWYDLRVVKRSHFRVKPVDERNAWQGRAKQKTGVRPLVLPRTVREITWDDGIKHAWEQSRGVMSQHPVRAHYRLLTNDQQASEQAIDNALNHGFPEPPDGYTFVRPYWVGEGDGSLPPQRIVAKGLQAAKVALSRL